MRSFYSIIKFWGVVHPLKDSLWKLLTSPKIHVFLWLVINNKVLTRDNLAKRRHVEYLTCMFCVEKKNVAHLFFECVIARFLWTSLVDVFDLPAILYFEDLCCSWGS